MTADQPEVKVEERVVLEKFEGEPKPENLVERLHLVDGSITHIESFENGELVDTQTVKEEI